MSYVVLSYPDQEEKYPLVLQWGDAEVLSRAIGAAVGHLLGWKRTGQSMTPAQALALRPLRKLQRRLLTRSWREQNMPASKAGRRPAFKCSLPFDELLAAVEQCRPTRQDHHHAAYMRLHQAAQVLTPAIQLSA